MKGQARATARDLSKTNINNMSDEEFKAIIRTLSGLEKRTEDISDTLSTEIKEVKNSQSQRKSAINRIINRLDVKNSRLDEAEERINDLEDKVMESNALDKREKNYATKE